MKRFIAAAALAALATSALAVEFGKPYEQLDIDRALPQIVVGERTQVAATAGATRSDVEIAADERPASSPWANDHNFVAPAQ